MTFSARAAAKAALWILPVALFVGAVLDLAFNQLEPGAVDWQKGVGRAFALTVVLSVLAGRRKAR